MPNPSEPRRRILVVDDEEGFRDGVADLLSMEGYAVSVARNAVEAVPMLPDFRPDVIMATPSYMLSIVDELERQGIDPRSTSLRVGKVSQTRLEYPSGICNHIPPAIAGTMLISSPSLTGVSRFFRKRMSSSLR